MDAHVTDTDESARPAKRQRPSPAPCALPLPVLLLSLPSLLLHPPTHRSYFKSSYLSLLALQLCSSYENLDADLECKAWTGLAELGFRLGFAVHRLEHETEKAITKALLIAQNHPSLRSFKIHLTLLSARLTQHQLNFRFSQNTLRRLLTEFISPQDPPNLVYASHLSYISSMSLPDSSGALLPTVKSLGAIQDLFQYGKGRGHDEVVKLASVLRLQTLIQMGSIENVGEALGHVEELLSFPVALRDTAATFAHMTRSTNETAFLLYTLILGAVYYTHIGDSAATEARTKVLHEMLDGNALASVGPHGVLEIAFTGSDPLYVQTSHPRILFALAFLVTGVAKRDPVGRKPKRKVFSAEGLLVVERELKKETALPLWASAQDVYEHRTRFQKMKADLMCEIIGVCVMRSEFGEAEKTLAELIAHTRNEGIFNYYSARITLLQAQLSHALGLSQRALQCYRVAAHLSRKRDRKVSLGTPDNDDDGVEDQWTYASSCAGELWVQIGIAREEALRRGYHEVYTKQREYELQRMAEGVTAACDGLGGTLGAIACVLRACLANEFLTAKVHLRQALRMVTSASDNHLRALILALIASQYFNTSQEHTEAMLATAEQLAAGLGAQPRPASALKAESKPTPQGKIGDGVGNAPLRLWIGERTHELKRRAGDEVGARNQELLNRKLRAAVKKIEQRKSLFAPADPALNFSKLYISCY